MEQNTITIRAAAATEYEYVRTFYHLLTDAMQGTCFDIGWKKDIYPEPNFLKKSIADGELFVGTKDDRIAAAMILNHKCNDGYKDAPWKVNATADKITVVHALGVHPDFTGRGFAKQLVAFALDYARNTGQAAVRLDVLSVNIPAERVYTGAGFVHICDTPLFYEDSGWMDSMLYEYVL